MTQATIIFLTLLLSYFTTTLARPRHPRWAIDTSDPAPDASSDDAIDRHEDTSSLSLVYVWLTVLTILTLPLIFCCIYFRDVIRMLIRSCTRNVLDRVHNYCCIEIVDDDTHDSHEDIPLTDIGSLPSESHNDGGIQIADDDILCLVLTSVLNIARITGRNTSGISSTTNTVDE